MPGSLQEQVAGEVRAELARRRMTQAALAEALGRSEPYVTRRLRGETAFDVADIERIAEILDVPINRLMPSVDSGSAA